MFPYVPTSSVITGRDTAKNVFVECKIASKKTINARPYDYRFQFRLNRYIRNGYIRSLRAIDFVQAKHSTRAINARPYDYRFQFRLNRYIRNGYIRSLQGCGAKHSSALMLREAKTVFSATSIPGNKTVCHTCVTRNVTVSSVAPNRASAKRSTALMYGGSFTVSSVTSIPGRQRYAYP